MAKRIVFFNHKGGVSKTTSAYNIAWMIARDHRVLIVDADSQCNLTSLILGDSFDKYYLDPETSKQNIRDAISPAFEGKPLPIQAVQCFSPPRCKNLFLLAGHANLSEYDASLTFAQTSGGALAALQNLPGAFARLLELTEKKYNIEYTVIDLNPSLSAINQNFFLISDAFVVPTNPDPFSIMALGTLRSVLPRWAKWKDGAVNEFKDSAYPLPNGTPKFAGALIQRFNVRRGKPAKPYRDNIAEIKEKLKSELFPALEASNLTFSNEKYLDFSENGYCIGEIPDFQGLLPKAHDAGVPVFELSDDEIEEKGVVEEGFKVNRARFYEILDAIKSRIIKVIE